MFETLTIELDPRDAAHIRKRAAEIDLTPEQWVLATAKVALASDAHIRKHGVDPDPIIDARILQQTVENDDAVPAERVFAELRERAEQRFAKRA